MESAMLIFKIALIVASVIFFVMAGFNVPKYAWQNFGFACLAATLLVQ